ncbi:hypothetical protein MSAR_10640 [Mycolicibacterium sarraceniae]|uniref:DUF559 domain-containing protein n=1 Tax=Mycolicibacterium sarraceniae TaxID=1534348 RepID=A0A7I7SMC5_9MYCO|nr:hypothetical protein MSAR_10640 [Mycolicibacterium sarraceniae]
MGLVDGGAQSPKETWLRLLLIDAGLPRPQTQIPVFDEFGELVGYLDIDWEDIKVAAECDGEQHRKDRWQYTRDNRRREFLEQPGSIIIRVLAGDRQADIIRRVREPSPAERDTRARFSVQRDTGVTLGEGVEMLRSGCS